MTKRAAVFDLVIAGAFWGFGFVATQWALKVFTTSETLSLRFLIAFLVGELARRWIYPQKLPWDIIWTHLKFGLGAGFFLAGCLLLQTQGLKYTSATNSGFITCLYILIVPIIGILFLGHPKIKGLFFYALIALLGAYLMMLPQDSFTIEFSDFNRGDVLTLACSFMAAFHILFIGFASRKTSHGFLFNNFQSLGCLLWVAPTLLLNQSLQFPKKIESVNQISMLPDFYWALLGVLIIAIGCSTFAFFLQIKAQKVLSPSEASMLFLLESPFAMIFGILLGSDHLTFFKFLGATLIMLAAYLTIRSEFGSDYAEHLQQKKPQ